MLAKTILTRSATLAFFVAWSFVPVVASSPDRPASEKATAARSSVAIDNFGQINEHYYRGAQPGDGDYANLARIGIRTLINLTSDDARDNEQSLVEGAGMRYVQIPMTTHEAPTAEKLARFLSIVNDPASQPVYVHCVGGRHRTGVMSAVYRMTHDGWSADQAFKEMKLYKFGADSLHREFKKFIFGYDATSAFATAAPAVVAKAVRAES